MSQLFMSLGLAMERGNRHRSIGIHKAVAAMPISRMVQFRIGTGLMSRRHGRAPEKEYVGLHIKRFAAFMGCCG